MEAMSSGIDRSSEVLMAEEEEEAMSLMVDMFPEVGMEEEVLIDIFLEAFCCKRQAN